mmetsp:Transcript_6766/g.16439  ORF Transcript_6766/g.16439 Transcript_6766/m.16439 type:complete len:545 (-) Transcript_6766:224-1858(-)
MRRLQFQQLLLEVNDPLQQHVDVNHLTDHSNTTALRDRRVRSRNNVSNFQARKGLDQRGSGFESLHSLLFAAAHKNLWVERRLETIVLLHPPRSPHNIHDSRNGLFDFRCIEPLLLLRVRRDADRLHRLETTPARQTLEKFLGDEGHHGVQQPQPSVQTPEEHVLGSQLGLLVVARHHWLDRLEEDVAQLVEPEVVGRRNGIRKGVLLKAVVASLGRGIQPRQNPDVDGLGTLEDRLEHRGIEAEVLADTHQRKASRVPQLVAELAVRHDPRHIEIEIPCLQCVREKPVAKRVGAALGKALREVELQSCGSLDDLIRVQVALLQLLLQPLQGSALNDLDRINHIAQGFAHLAAILVPDHRVQENGIERQLVCQREPHHDHPRDPEEQNIVPGFQHRRRIKLGKVHRLRLGPPKHRERKEPRREPRIQHILILNQLVDRNLAPELLLGLKQRVLLCATHKPLLHALRIERLVRGNPMAPPQLPRNAPVADVIEPAVPIHAEDLRQNRELAAARRVRGALRHFPAVDPPLRLEHRLDDVRGLGAEP